MDSVDDGATRRGSNNHRMADVRWGRLGNPLPKLATLPSHLISDLTQASGPPRGAVGLRMLANALGHYRPTQESACATAKTTNSINSPPYPAQSADRRRKILSLLPVVRPKGQSWTAHGSRAGLGGVQCCARRGCVTRYGGLRIGTDTLIYG